MKCFFCFHNLLPVNDVKNQVFQLIALLLGHRPHLLQLTHEILGFFPVLLAAEYGHTQ